MWFKTEEDKPEVGREVLGFNQEWVDPDFNPEGICMCFVDDDGDWTIAKWCNQHDEWHTRNTNPEKEDADQYEKPIEAPTHWKYKDRKIV